MEVTLTILFLIDVVINFNTAFLEDDAWVTSRYRIASNYMQV